MTNGIVFDIRRYSIHDGPGIRTTVFFKGCPLGCAWCHNPESRTFTPELILRPNRCILCEDCLEACPNGAVSRRGDAIVIDRERCRVSGECVAVCAPEALEIVGWEMSSEQVMAGLERDRPFYDQSGGGVTFSGGEPLAQPAFLLELLKACRDRGLHTAVDTSGFASWSIFERVRPYVNLFLYDLKLMDEARHRRQTGVSNRKILANLARLADLGHRTIVRIPVIPGVNDSTTDLRQAGEFLADLPTRLPVELLAYHHTGLAKYRGLGLEYGLPDLRPPEAARMEAVAGILREYGLQVTI